EERFQAAMDDDFNTPEAMAVFFDVVRDINKYRDTALAQAADAGAALRHFAGVIGLLGSDPEHYLKWGRAGAKAPKAEQATLADEDVERLLEQRAAARNRRDWAESDRIRACLVDRGVILEDSATGTRWRRV
ncbi:MAG: DALR domain-containing protein, partial [Gammaproteobacteria bacterium]